MNFDYINIEDIRPGMLINYTMIKGNDAVNVLILSCEIVDEALYPLWKIVGVADDGQKCFFCIDTELNANKQIRVFSKVCETDT